jgi:hypothetical protein
MNKSRPLPAPRQTHVIHDLTRRVREASAEALRDHVDAVALPALRVTPAASALAPRRMAQAQASDPATREQLEASYRAALDCYRRLARERLGDEGSDDVGAAVAFYVAVNLHALHGIDMAAEVLVPLERQLRAVTKLVANWDHAGIAARQDFFERIAIVAILVSGAAARAAASQDESARAEVRRNAHDYLQQLLGLDPERMALDAHGLVLRDATPAA